jgi:hypothetical protein
MVDTFYPSIQRKWIQSTPAAAYRAINYLPPDTEGCMRYQIAQQKKRKQKPQNPHKEPKTKF